MSNSPENEVFLPRDQTPLRTKHTAGRRFQQNFTPPPPPHFTPTPGTGGSTQPEGTPMTYDQYLDLKNDYRTMMEELRKYNELGASQQGPTATRLPPQREPEPSDSNEAQASSGSWKPQYSSTKRSSGASESSSVKSRRRKSQAYQANHVTKAEMQNVMQELQQLKKVRPDF